VSAAVPGRRGAARPVAARPVAARPVAARIGLFGGTFDPPHVGHLALAEWARVQLRLDKVVFIPAGTPPHKAAKARTAAAQRLALTRLAVRGNAAFEVSAIETRRKGPSWTVDTVREFAQTHPRARLWLLMGADMFDTFGTWREPEGILECASVAVALRPGSRRPRTTKWARVGHGVEWLDNPGLEVSSSALRTRAARGLALRYLVPDAVARQITRIQLYRSGS
jgi:nicotinate-nucleotide adenylyltransferase